LENELKINIMKKVLYFSTTWCGPCKAFKPVVQQVAQETGIQVNYIDAEADPALAKMYSVTSVPTIVIADQMGSALYRHTGPMPKGQLLQLINTIG
jgi:thiol-disulfide isomerase/thioredoxin